MIRIPISQSRVPIPATYHTAHSIPFRSHPIRPSPYRPTRRRRKSPFSVEDAQCFRKTPIKLVIRSSRVDGESSSSSMSEDDEEVDGEGNPVANFQDTLIFVMRLPFLYASTLAATNDQWLQQRNRSKWWSRGYFPKVPKFTVRDAMRNEKVNHPFRLVQKMAPLGLIFFCATFNLCILQTMKDSLIVSTIGAESLPFLASFGVLPASFLFFGFYHYLLNRMPQKWVFYLTLLPLLGVYAFFAGVLYPASDWLHPHGVFDTIVSNLPLGFHGLIRCLENWTFSVFFCIAELWGGIVISVLFWSLANEVCSVTEATTIYPLMGLSANVALVFAGKLIKFINQSFTSVLVSYRILISIVIFNSLLMMFGKFFIDRTISNQPLEDSSKKLKTRKKTKGSLKDSLRVLKESPKIWNLAMLVIGYSVSHRLFDVVWKGQLKLIYPTPQQYQTVLADVSVWTGISTILMLLTGKFIFQYLGWGVAASALPMVMLLTGSIFYCSFFAMDQQSMSTSFARVGVLAGNVTQVATRAAKFSLFDPAKEMVYIEMNKEEKGKGKAAVDLVGSQIGKTGASWICQGLLLSFGSISASMPVFGLLSLSVIIIWLLSVKKLQTLLAQTEAERKQRKKKSERKKSEIDSHSTEGLPSENGDRPVWMTGTRGPKKSSMSKVRQALSHQSERECDLGDFT